MKCIRSALRAAVCALVGVAGSTRTDAAELDTALLVYSELDRVTAFESFTRARTAMARGMRLNLNLTVDIMVGASANGATQTNETQTFTRPSGRGHYVIRPGETPLDDTFQDNRVGVDAQIEVPVATATLASFGTAASIEYDYTSIAGRASLSRSFNKRNTTLAGSASFANDELDPEGGRPIPFASMAAPWDPQPRLSGKGYKRVTDVVLGVTQVLNRRTITEVNYALSHSEGYHTDPFKLISVIEANPGPDLGRTVDYIYEHRPDRRTKHSIFTNLKHHLERDVVDLAYRFMRDTWGITSHTAELSYHWLFRERRSLRPQVRVYHQTAADFYLHSLRNTTVVPVHASADYRLGEFTALTFAIRYGHMFRGGSSIHLRLGYYVQMGNSKPDDAVGIQRQFDLFPTVRALMTQVSYQVAW